MQAHSSLVNHSTRSLHTAQKVVRFTILSYVHFGKSVYLLCGFRSFAITDGDSNFWAFIISANIAWHNFLNMKTIWKYSYTSARFGEQ